MDMLGILFDMDGVLVDSEPVITAAAREALNQFGISAKTEDFKEFTGMGENRFLGGVCEKYGKTFDPAMKTLCYEIYGKLVDEGLTVYPGVRDVLRELARKGRKLALATSADMVKAEQNLRVAGIPFDTFQTVLTGENVERKKPFPDIYLKAAEGLGLPAERCVVAEDAVSGIRAATAAGARSVGITTSFDAATLMAAGATRVISDIRDLPEAICEIEGRPHAGT